MTKSEREAEKVVEEFSKRKMEFLCEQVEVGDSEKEADFILSKDRIGTLTLILNKID